MKKVCVLGLGYIGLPTAAMLATHGFQVIGVDTNLSIVNTVNNSDVHIEEPGLRTLVQAACKSGNLLARSKPEPADAFIICVPTPLDPEKQADLSYVTAAAQAIVPHLGPGNLVVLESTVPPGTTVQVVLPILEKSGLKPGADFYLAHCPERVLPGQIIKEILENNRVIGGVTEDSARRARSIYSTFVTGNLYLTDATTAELVKIVENTFRDVNIALANELALICDRLGLDVWNVIELANRHPRVNFLNPGPGVGGHCISVDPWFLVEKAPEEARLVRLSREINDTQPYKVLALIEQAVKGIKDPKVTVLGVAYKGNVDDTRESPALAVVERLKERGYMLSVIDPHVKQLSQTLSDVKDGFAGSDIAVLLTDHSKFRDLDPETLGRLMRTRQLLDTRNFLVHHAWQKAGFKVSCLGCSQQQRKK
jgi:UDP-N-acetyl-D-mannosaminuronic acid dehydrogenase